MSGAPGAPARLGAAVFDRSFFLNHDIDDLLDVW